MRHTLTPLVGLMASLLCSSTMSADPYDALYDSIVVRDTSDGQIFDPTTPPLWLNSRYLVEGGADSRFMTALLEFNKLSPRRVAGYPILHRATLQHHLWTVFDWTTSLDGLDTTRVSESNLHAMQSALAVAIQALALSKSEISRLPDPLAASARSGSRTEGSPESEEVELGLPRDLLDAEGPWLCLAKLDHAVPAIVHTESVNARSAFLILARLPEGREATLDYFEKLASFRTPWVEGPPETFVNIARHPAMMSLNLHDHPGTPQVPIGTQFALVQKAMLISDRGELILSPLVQNVQIRRHLDVQVDRRGSRRSAPTQAFAEFVLEPRAMMSGRSPMRRIGSDEVRHTTTFSSNDPIENPRERPSPRLKTCLACHSASGIHAMNSRTELFQTRSLVPPRFAAVLPSAVGASTARLKRKQYAWGLLRGLLRGPVERP